MTQCERCGRKYPDDCCAPMDSRLVCGICALDLTNEIHNTHFKCFIGEQAEATRQRALSASASGKKETRQR